jgi:hypothetical protein
VPASRRPALLLAALCALACVSGCTAQGGIGLAKVTFQRTTIPADHPDTSGGGGGSSSGNVPISNAGGAFDAARLRTLDACQLIDQDTVAALGHADDPSPEGLGACDVDLEDSGGNDLDITLTVGDQLDDDVTASTTVDGMPVNEHQDDSDCAERIITGTDPALAVTIEVDYDGHDSCAAARKLIDPVIRRIRSNPPQISSDDARLATVDPCGTLDDAAVSAAVGPDSDKSTEGLFKCDWDANDYELSVGYSYDSDPATDDAEGTPKPVTVGGIAATSLLTTDVFPSCEIKWKLGPKRDDQYQQIDVEFDNIEDKPGIDPCAKATAAATTAMAKLPRPEGG